MKDMNNLPPLLEAAKLSFVSNMAVFIINYSGAYFWVYGVFASVLQPWKLNPRMPPPLLVAKEMRRSTTSALVCVALDVVLGHWLDVFHVTASIADAESHLGIWELPWRQPLLILGLWKARWKMIVFVVLWADCHFYWMHRFLHESKWLYQNVHKFHHESINPNPWSGLSFHPIEAAMYFSCLGIVFVVPLDRWLYDGLRIGLLLAPIAGHVGFGHPSFPWGYDHFVHHSKFNYNFSSGLLPFNGIWDNVCGTGYKQGSKATLQRSADAAVQAAVAAGERPVPNVASKIDRGRVQ
eukprot:TRINITY_DN50437_c0_g1_i1.p1 TRINITY_DN50437_c0_g1~~TRINITY_DN50437_c0_g1_i1.p1  ORF type:complete len:314 (-),score=40.81 TRINITY_DN50437_c0_g1_i1:396-1280(-)